jgi:hypothetical protein
MCPFSVRRTVCENIDNFRLQLRVKYVLYWTDMNQNLIFCLAKFRGNPSRNFRDETHGQKQSPYCKYKVCFVDIATVSFCRTVDRVFIVATCYYM